MASDRPPQTPAPLSAAQIERHKEAAARAAAELIVDGMHVGLGTGTTVAYLLTALGERAAALSRARFAATSPATAQIAAELGLTVVDLDRLGELDLAIDGADQVDPDSWLIKGGGGAHTREKIVASSARRFVVIVSAEKLVTRLEPPVPLEILRFGASQTLSTLGAARLRTPAEHESVPIKHGSTTAEHGSETDNETEDSTVLRSPDGNLLAWCDLPIADPRVLAARLSQTPGVVEHGLFAPELVSEILIAGPGGITRRAVQPAGLGD
jgi:ribose 5-phosphate isomerase A